MPASASSAADRAPRSRYLRAGTAFFRLPFPAETEQLRSYCDHGRAWKQPARGRGKTDRGSLGTVTKRITVC